MFRLRCASKEIALKHFAEENRKGRVEFVPVEWRSSLKLDEGVIDLVTPHTVRGVRNVINTSMMDIMYYTSPFYREEVSLCTISVQCAGHVRDVIDLLEMPTLKF